MLEVTPVRIAGLPETPELLESSESSSDPEEEDRLELPNVPEDCDDDPDADDELDEVGVPEPLGEAVADSVGDSVGDESVGEAADAARGSPFSPNSISPQPLSSRAQTATSGKAVRLELMRRIPKLDHTTGELGLRSHAGRYIGVVTSAVT